MILELYAIYDKKLGEYLPPFCCKNESDAIRMCSNLVNHSDSLMLKFPEDYECNLVGKFDTEQGTVFVDLSASPHLCVEFKNLVKDHTTKYKDILNKIESASGVIDNKLMLLSDKINKLDTLSLEYTTKFDKLLDTYNGSLGDISRKYGVSNDVSIINKDNSVECPDFLPVNNNKSKKSFLDKLFS